MDRVNSIAILISVLALAVAAYALGSIDRTQPVATATEVAGPVDARPARSGIGRIRAASNGIAVSRNRMGGAGAVELWRGNRLDIFGGLGEGILLPPDPFDLSPIDEAAADKLTAALVAPSSVQPFNPFPIAWEVAGPSSALARVNSYQINVFGTGPISGLSAEPSLTSEGLKAQGSVITSMWKSGSVKLWARFGSGIKELEVIDVEMDVSGCREESLDLGIPILLFQSHADTPDAGATQFVQRVRQAAGEDDVTVTVLESAVAGLSSDGVTFDMKLKLEGSGATLIVDLGMQFMIVPKAGHLGASFAAPGYRTVEIDADLPWYDDAWHTITLGKHNLSSYYGSFRDGLAEFADGFASSLGRQVRGLPGLDNPNYDSLEAEAPKAVATVIDMSNDQLIVTLCPIPGGLIPVSGVFPTKAMKFDTP